VKRKDEKRKDKKRKRRKRKQCSALFIKMNPKINNIFRQFCWLFLGYPKTNIENFQSGKAKVTGKIIGHLQTF